MRYATAPFNESSAVGTGQVPILFFNRWTRMLFTLVLPSVSEHGRLLPPDVMTFGVLCGVEIEGGTRGSRKGTRNSESERAPTASEP